MYGDCEWENAECARDAVESKVCNVLQAIVMFGNQLFSAASASLSLQNAATNMRERKVAGAAMRIQVWNQDWRSGA